MIKWTQAQANAIHARGGTVLVSAAAGSGKTAVLVERVIEMLLDEQDPVDVDRLLIVTFTNAAAAEMRERIGKAFITQLKLHPDNQHLLRQQMLLPGAKICTIDAFCKDLVQENFYKLHIAQDFRLLDENEKKIMEEECAASVLEWFYEEAEPAFLSLVELLSSARNDHALQQHILKLHEYIMAHPFPERWLQEMAGKYQSDKELDQTLWCQMIQTHKTNALCYMKKQLMHCCTAIQTDPVLFEKVQPILEDDIAQIENALRPLPWDETMQALQSIAFARFPSIRGYGDDPTKNQVCEIRQEVKASLKPLLSLYCATAEEHRADMQKLAPIVEALARVVWRFHQVLMERKMTDNHFTFSDIEHFALHLLVQETEDAYQCTDLAFQLRSRYAQILIDEYQDTNRAQDLLFQSISDGNNLFMVGDVKQSIYRFRQAMPQIFTEKKEQFSHYDGRTYPAQIVLDENFRSRPEICGFINYIFTLLFSKEVGELEYNADEYLNAGAVYEKETPAPVSIHILESDGIDKKQTDAYEAEYLARLIRSKIQAGETVAEKGGGHRNITYGDFAILFRSAAAHIPNYISVFQQYGIPVSSEATSDFFNTPEVVTILSLLRVLDNPLQDIPLLSIMLSPIFGFTPDELSVMKIEDRFSTLYTSISHFAKNGDLKTQKFLQTLEHLRTYSVAMPAGTFIRTVYDEISYRAIAQSMGEPEQRLANLHLLLEYADAFEASGRRGLSAFIRYIDKIKESGQKMNAANVQNGSTNAVKMMSIHRSKGLEFPVCIIAGTNRIYNTSNLRESVLLHPELGAGLKVQNEELLYQYPSIPYHAIRLANKNAEMSENLRVLYVAMTRAKEQLLLMVTTDKLQRKLGKLATSVSAGELNSYLVGNTTSDADLLLRCALLHPDGKSLRRLCGAEVTTHHNDTAPLHIKVVHDLEQLSVQATEQEPAAVEPELVHTIQERLNYEYPYKVLSGIAAKRNASSLDESVTDFHYFAASRPAFLSADGLTAAQKGTAMHRFMQHCSYHNAFCDLSKEADRMLELGFLSDAERTALSEKKLASFFYSDFAQRIYRADRVMREIKFAAFVPAGSVYTQLAGISEEQIYVQGIADCVFVEQGQMVVVDYKTDHIKNEDVLLERYRNQLQFYCRALEETYQMPVKECYLYSFYLERPLRYDFI